MGELFNMILECWWLKRYTQPPFSFICLYTKSWERNWIYQSSLQPTRFLWHEGAQWKLISSIAGTFFFLFSFYLDIWHHVSSLKCHLLSMPRKDTLNQRWKDPGSWVHFLSTFQRDVLGVAPTAPAAPVRQFSRSVVSDSLQPHESQHARPPCPSPTPGVHPNSHPSSRWCHPAISSSVVPFSSRPQCLPASESFPMSQLFAWGGQRTGVSASASFLPKKSQDWSPLRWTGWISLQSKGLSRVFSNTTVQKHQFFRTQPSSQSNSHIHTWSLEKP